MPTPTGEPPLSAFVSSVLNDEYLWARQAAEEELRSRGWAPWVFEHTPASSEELVEGYLRKVREADLVVWLCGHETTQPVAKEIRAAIANKRRILILRIAPGPSDETTEVLVHDVGGKYQTAYDAPSLRMALSAAIDDETARAFRGVARASRVSVLRERRSESRGRCVARWCAAGVRDDLAFEMADDPRIGTAAIALDSAARVQLLTGEIGSGKSLFAERLLQTSIDDLLAGTPSPVPLYLEARFSSGSLREQVRLLAEPVGSVDDDGCFVILDGIDEITSAAALTLIDEARSLAYTYSKVRVVVVARPVPAIVAEFTGHVVHIPPLETEDAIVLINRVSGRADELSARWWPDSLTEALRRPLFAILFAVTRRQHGEAWPTRAELVRALVEQSLGRAQARRESADPLLRRLGVRAVDSGNSVVPEVEIAPYAELAPLLESRLITSRDDRLGFPLVIFAEWFAAQSLRDGEPAVAELCEDRQRLRRWLPALELSVNGSSFVDASRVLSPVCSRHPALASQLTERSFPEAGPSDEHWDWRQLGNEVRAAMEQWAVGLGPLATIVGPVAADGRAFPVGIRIGADRSLVVAWFSPGQGGEPVSELPLDFSEAHPGRYWTWLWAAPRGRAWAWHWAYETLRHGLKSELDRHGLPAPPSLEAEYLWQAASSIMGRNSLTQDPISVSRLASALSHYPSHGVLNTSRGLSFELSRMREAVGRIAGEELQAPWPGPDERGGPYIWSGFRPATLLERAEAVYLAALKGYSELVDLWFPRLKPELPGGSRMPVSVIGVVKPAESGPFGHPAIIWRVEPGVQVEHTIVSLQLADGEDWSRARTDFQRLREERGAGYTESHLEVFGFDAARRLAYSWLRDDLRAVDWY